MGVALCLFSVGFWLLQLFIHDGGIRSLLIGKVCLSLLASQGGASLAASSEANAKKIARLLALRSANEATVASEPLTFWFDASGTLLTGFHQLLQLQLLLDKQQQQHHEGADEKRPAPLETKLQQQQDSVPCKGDTAASSWEGADDIRPEPVVVEPPQPAQASSTSKCISVVWTFVKALIFGVIIGGTLCIALALLTQWRLDQSEHRLFL